MRSDNNILLLQGGLGNQLFQCCIAEDLVRLFNKEIFISDYLLSSKSRLLRGLTFRPLSPLITLNSYLGPKTPLFAARILHRVPRVSSSMYQGAMFSTKYFQSTVYKGDGLSVNLFDASYACYWQKVIDNLDSIYGSPDRPISFAMHIRRGDYNKPSTKMLSGLYPLPIDYYVRAASRLGFDLRGACKPLIFTDSPLQVANEFFRLGINNYELNNMTSAEQVLWLMSHTSNLVISNSSLSAIAAHLSSIRSISDNIVAPLQWSCKPIASRLVLRRPQWHII